MKRRKQGKGEGNKGRDFRVRESVEEEDAAYMKERCGKERGDQEGGGWGEDTALHPQSSVRLHKYWVHGRVAGSQVNMKYEYCRSHSLASCPPQLLMSGSELAQLLLEALLSSARENELETETDGQTDIKEESP